MSRESNNIGLHFFAVFTATATLPLIFIGGLVTSHDAGLAVPDWPTSYGYNMFLFPWHKMVGGIFYEHSHRLVASAVGFLTIILAAWLGMREDRRWVRRLGMLALVLVIVQGVLGGLRVTMLMRGIAVFHACLAQTFFCLLAAIAMFTSPWWRKLERESRMADGKRLRQWSVGLTALIFFQLTLAAAMRHTVSGLAVPDFPTMYGRWIPPLDASKLEELNRMRFVHWNLDPVAFWQIGLHLAHRFTAFIIAGVAGSVFIRSIPLRQTHRMVYRMISLVVFLVLAQIGLGIFVIWTGKAADVATAHVALGALILMVSFLCALICHRTFCPPGVLASIPHSGIVESPAEIAGH